MATKDKMVTLRFTAATVEWIEAEAKLRGVKRAQMLTEMLTYASRKMAATPGIDLRTAR